MVGQVSHILVALAAGWFIIAAYRWIRSRSAVVAAIVAATILGRLAFGLALFWVSYLNLPIARSLQVSGGFWQVALDATGYYQMAARAVDAGRLFPLDHSVPAPFFIDTLAVWMMAVGVSPAAGMFLNLLLYVTLAVMVVWSFAPVNDIRRDLPCIVGVAAYSLSPVILFHSSQPLKDELSAFLLGLACLGITMLRPLFDQYRTARDWWAVAGGTVAVTVATLGTSGIRWYFGFVLWGALVVALGAGVVLALLDRRGPRLALLKGTAAAVLVLIAAFIAFRAGAGPFYRVVIGANLDRLAMPHQTGGSFVGRIAAIPHDLLNMAQMARTGFVMSGGGTNLVVPLGHDATAGLNESNRQIETQHATAAYREAEAAVRAASRRGSATSHEAIAAPASPVQPSQESATPATLTVPDEYRAVPITTQEHLQVVATGIAIVFVPVSLLKAVAQVQITGGRGLLSIADLDTVFLDVMSLAVLILLWKRRHMIGDRRVLVLFGLVLSVTTAVLLGYVVTNFGTLWRMRSLVAVPLWLLVSALSPRRAIRRQPPTAPGQVPAAT